MAVSGLCFWRLCRTINRLIWASFTCSSVFSVVLGLINTFYFYLTICYFFPQRKSCDYAYSLPLWGEFIDAFSSLWIAFSICFCLPGSSCCIDCFCIFFCMLYFLTILYHLWILYIYQTSHSCNISPFSQSCEIAVVSSHLADKVDKSMRDFPVVPEKFLNPWLVMLAQVLDHCSYLSLQHLQVELMLWWFVYERSSLGRCASGSPVCVCEEPVLHGGVTELNL